MLSQGANGGLAANAGITISGKKTTGSFKQVQDGDQQMVIGANNLILSRGRPPQIESSQRVTAANMPANPGQTMNYSKTLTQHMQQIQ